MQATPEAVNHEWLRYKFEIRVEHHTFGFRIYFRSNAVKKKAYARRRNLTKKERKACRISRRHLQAPAVTTCNDRVYPSIEFNPSMKTSSAKVYHALICRPAT